MLRRPRGPKPNVIRLTARQRSILEHIVRSPQSPQCLALRSKIILLADEGLRNQHIADDLGVYVQTPTLWRGRWFAAAERLAAAESTDKELELLVREVLSDSARTGRPFTFMPEQVCQIIALACESPAASGRPITHWTTTALADEAMKRGIVDKISPRSVGRLLKSG
jgi:putative transposase